MSDDVETGGRSPLVSKPEIMDYVRSVVPMVVQLRRRPTRGVAEIYFRGFGGKA